MSTDIFGRLAHLQGKRPCHNLTWMANESLKNALQSAGLQPDDLAEQIEVDVKTVRRWLYGARPYPRHRTRIAHALHTPELELWPELTPDREDDQAPAPVRPGRDLIAIYPTRDHPAAPDPELILHDAKHHVDLLIPTFRSLAMTRELPQLLIAKARAGCAVRVLTTRRPVETPEPIAKEVDQLLNTLLDEGAALRAIQTTYTVNTIIRADDLMLVTLYHYPLTPAQSPCLHLRKQAAGDLFDQYLAHLEAVWPHAKPVQPGTNADPRSTPDRQRQKDDTDLPDDPAATRAEPPTPRRWPGRTA